MKRYCFLVALAVVLGCLCPAAERARADITIHCDYVEVGDVNCGTCTWPADTYCGPGHCIWVDEAALLSAFCGCYTQNYPYCGDTFHCLEAYSSVIGCVQDTGGGGGGN